MPIAIKASGQADRGEASTNTTMTDHTSALTATGAQLVGNLLFWYSLGHLAPHLP